MIISRFQGERLETLQKVRGEIRRGLSFWMRWDITLFCFRIDRQMLIFTERCGSESFIHAPTPAICLLCRDHKDVVVSSTVYQADSYQTGLSECDLWSAWRLPTPRWAKCRGVIGVPYVGDTSRDVLLYNSNSETRRAYCRNTWPLHLLRIIVCPFVRPSVTLNYRCHSLTHCCAWSADGRSDLHNARSRVANWQAPMGRPISSYTCWSHVLRGRLEVGASSKWQEVCRWRHQWIDANNACG